MAAPPSPRRRLPCGRASRTARSQAVPPARTRRGTPAECQSPLERHAHWLCRPCAFDADIMDGHRRRDEAAPPIGGRAAAGGGFSPVGQARGQHALPVRPLLPPLRTTLPRAWASLIGSRVLSEHLTRATYDTTAPDTLPTALLTFNARGVGHSEGRSSWFSLGRTQDAADFARLGAWAHAALGGPATCSDVRRVVSSFVDQLSRRQG